MRGDVPLQQRDNKNVILEPEQGDGGRSIAPVHVHFLTDF